MCKALSHSFVLIALSAVLLSKLHSGFVESLLFSFVTRLTSGREKVPRKSISEIDVIRLNKLSCSLTNFTLMQDWIRARLKGILKEVPCHALRRNTHVGLSLEI